MQKLRIMSRPLIYSSVSQVLPRTTSLDDDDNDVDAFKAFLLVYLLKGEIKMMMKGTQNLT